MSVTNSKTLSSNSATVQLGRPRATVNFALILRYRTVDNLGWLRVAQRYRKETGEFIGKDTCRRRYEEYIEQLEKVVTQ